jgi:hypothetical protein
VGLTKSGDWVILSSNAGASGNAGIILDGAAGVFVRGGVDPFPGRGGVSFNADGGQAGLDGLAGYVVLYEYNSLLM